MKILLISTAAGGAGGYVAAARLLRALRGAGADAHMLVRDGRVDDAPGVLPPLAEGRVGRALTQARLAAEYARLAPLLTNWRDVFQFSGGWHGWDISGHPAVQQADVINIHWTGKAFLSTADLAALGRLNKPVVWTLHDMWAMTGGCHYSGNCNRYVLQCGHCPYLRFPDTDDLSNGIWQRKHRHWEQLRPHIVTSSTWLADCASRSSLLRRYPVQSIPIPVDTAQFRPLPMAEARATFQLPTAPRILLFGASRIADPRKGWAELRAALHSLADRTPADQRPHLAVFGHVDEGVPMPQGYVIHQLGRLGPMQLQAAYSAADAFVIPSLEDNLPNTVLEALGCGSPIVGFAAGGIPDMVREGENGFLAPVGEVPALSRALEQLLLHPDPLALRASSRALAESTFSEASVAAQYLALFQALQA